MRGHDDDFVSPEIDYQEYLDEQEVRYHPGEDDIEVATQSDGTTMTATKKSDGTVSLKPEEPEKLIAFPANFDEDAIKRYHAIKNKRLSHKQKVSLVERHRANAKKPLKPIN